MPAYAEAGTEILEDILNESCFYPEVHEQEHELAQMLTQMRKSH